MKKLFKKKLLSYTDIALSAKDDKEEADMLQNTPNNCVVDYKKKFKICA